MRQEDIEGKRKYKGDTKKGNKKGEEMMQHKRN